MNKIWFKRKTYGWGWYPCTWQGWIVILAYVFVMSIYQYEIRNAEPDGNFLVGFMIPVIFFTAILIFICYKKGEKPRWQWGKDKEDQKHS